MRDSGGQLLGLVVLAAFACTLSPVLDPAGIGGSAGAAAPGGQSASAGTPSAGGASGGNASPNLGGAGTSGESHLGSGGSATGGASGSGGTTEGGAGGESGSGEAGGTDTTGGTGATGGTAGAGGGGGTGGAADGCMPGLSPCSDACVDLRTDPNHCGSCRLTCADGCSAGRCYTVVTEVPDDVIRLAANDTDIYFALRDTGTVSRVARTGGTVQILATAQDQPLALTLDANHVYWVNSGSTYGTGSVMKTSLSGGTPVALATDEPAPWDVHVDDTHVYWSNYPPNPGILMRVPISGGTKVELASGEAVGTTTEFSVDGSYVYWANWLGSQGSVWKVPATGGTVTNLVTVNVPASLAKIHASYVYFVAGSTLQRVSTAGGAPSDLTQIATAYFDVDDTGLYLGGFPEGGQEATLIKVALDGSTVSTLADVKRPFRHSTLGPSDVIWADGDRQIKMTSKTP